MRTVQKGKFIGCPSCPHGWEKEKTNDGFPKGFLLTVVVGGN